jgi:hypothetical protein
MAPGMRSSPWSSMRRFRFGWLLWLVMLVPAAQSAAAWHSYSHLAQTTRGDDPRILHPTHCDLCLAAANLAGGSLPADVPCPPACARCPVPAAVQVVSVSTTPPTPAYLSRAPPLTLL